MAVALVVFMIGLASLYLGADWLIRGSARLARDLGVSGLVIGLTVVAMGTSAPELIVGVVAAARDRGDIAIGNVVGSNIANIALILGLAAMIRPISVQMRLLKREVPIMIGAAVLFYVLAINGDLDRLDGLALLVGLTLFIVYLLRGARGESPIISAEYKKFTRPGGTLGGHIGLTALGVGTLLLGAHLVVEGASDAARILGISELAIGLTVIALGTSLPELATAVAASIHDEGDILVGNVVGSNVFNVCAVLGVASAIRPLDVGPTIILVEAPIMLAISVLLLPFVWTALRVSRMEGGILLAAYAAFIFSIGLPG
jgi:cation:H+ antiporter